jgi:hypothetical protein
MHAPLRPMHGPWNYLLFTLNAFTLKPNFYLIAIAVTLSVTTIVHAQSNIDNLSATPQPRFTNNKQPLADNLSADWYNQALKNIQAFEEQIHPLQTPGCYSAANRQSHTGYYISPAGYTVKNNQHPDWEVAFQLKGIGRSTLQWAPGSHYSIENK